MTESQSLLAAYAQSGSESAFRELVTRYVGLVYATALRMVEGDTHLAEDVTQTVFLDLARKAPHLSGDVMLGGWLHQRTFNVAAPMMRAARRRQSREREAVLMNPASDPSSADLAHIAPLLDEALTKLDQADRTAIILRFFERRDFRSIGAALGSNEDAARMRVTRALEKLHLLLKHRGVTLSATALGAALATEAVTAAPLGLALNVAGTALAGSAVTTSSAATLFKIGIMTKLKAGFIGAVAVAGVATTLVIQHQAQARLRSQDAALQRSSADLIREQAEHDRLAGLVPTAPASGNNLSDLENLRQQAAALRSQTNALAVNLEENRRLRARNAKLAPAPSILETREQERDLAIARMNSSRQWVIAFHLFASKNQDQFPDTFDAARPFLSDEAKADTNHTEVDFEILYQGSIATLTNAAELVLLREKQPRHTSEGKWSRAYAFADGHSEIASSPTDNFEAWEKRHIVPLPSDR